MMPDPRLEALARAPERAGIFCDFDGALAAIVPDPEDARPVPGAEEVLVRLSSRFGVVAVVSGRSLASLESRLTVPGVRLVGLHGIEQRVGDQVRVLPEAEAMRAAVERAAARLEDDVARPDVVVERKGHALAVHFRRAEDPEASQAAAEPAVRAVAETEGLAVEAGRRILEIRPPVRMDKGEAVRRIVTETRVTAGLFAGDDTGDLSAFRAVVVLDPGVRIAVESDESPPELLARADLRVGGPDALVALLRGLAG